MDSDQWRRARKLFERVADKPAEEWPARLLDECPHDAAVRTLAMDLLRADVTARDQQTELAGHAPDLVEEIAEKSDNRHCDAWIGRQLGAWTIVRVLGRGGMGLVYLGERSKDNFRQRAALKILRLGHDELAVARFIAERQILAELEHPNIARLVDGGSSEQSGPWFALEYIDGMPIDTWCDSKRLDTVGRLRLFLDICEAVAYAHERLIVHRDLKPGNILVSADGRVTLLDFGIAKLLDTTTAQTGTAVRTFTPEYAAPEQIRGEAISTAVDVYALGVLLCELLTGCKPYRVTTTSPLAYERAVLEQDPVRPSTLVMTRGIREGNETSAAGDSAARRNATPPALRALLRGDLDAIVLKTLRKEPSQRYATVRELASDVRASLSHRPVEARRGGLRYLAIRFLRRNRIAVSMAVLALLALVVGLVGALWQMSEAQKQRDTARESLAFMTRLFENADPGTSANGNPSVRDLLDEGVRNIRFAFSPNSVARAELLVAMASAYVGLELNDAALPLIIEAKGAAIRAKDPALYARTVIRECRILNYRNEFERCADMARQAERELDRSDPQQANLIGELTARRVATLIAKERHQELIEEIPPVLAMLEPSNENQETRVTLTAVLADALAALGRNDEAESIMRRLVGDLDSEMSVTPRNLANAKNFLSGILSDSGQIDEALELNREALEGFESLYGVDNPVNSTKMNNFAFALYNAGRIDDAIVTLHRVIEMNRTRPGGPGAGFGTWLHNMGAFMIRAGNDAQALEYFGEAVGHFEKSDNTQEMADSLWWRGAIHLAIGEMDEARTDFRRCIDNSESADGELILRARYSLATIDVIQRREPAILRNACRESRSVMTAYAVQDNPYEPDVAFAGFLADLCPAFEVDVGTREALLDAQVDKLSGQLPSSDVRWRFAHRVLEAASGAAAPDRP
jgi:serine/threonine protein kinase